MKRLLFPMFVLFLLLCVSLGGCSRLTNPWKWGQDREKKRSKTPLRTSFVRDYATPYNTHLVAIDGFGLVYGLRGTGAPEPPGQEREYMLRELQKKEVDRPNALLDSRDTAIVRLQGILPPGIQAGDRFDVKVTVRPGSEVKSLRGGYLMKTHLQEMALFGENNISKGFALADVEGPIMLNPTANEKTSSPIEFTFGKILGGGVLKESRPLYLVMKEEHVSEFNTDRIAKKINERFYKKVGSKTVGVAKAKTDTTVEILVHPTYKDNIERYMQVLMSVACYELADHRTKRIEKLRESVLVPETAQDAALQLEALGKPGVEALREALKSEDTEVRFYAAESLAYMNVVQAARPLAAIAKQEQAFRVRALSALSTMQNDMEAESCLRELLNENSAETRYGAFRSLWFRNPHDLAIRGEKLGLYPGTEFNYHVLNTQGAPMLHITNSKRPELVLFGSDIRLQSKFILDAGVSIMVRDSGPEEVIVSRINSRGVNEKRTVTNRLDEIIRAVAELGGTYPDVVQMLLEAQDQKVLTCKLEIDKLPQGGREYNRSKFRIYDDEDDSKKKKSFWTKVNPVNWVEGGDSKKTKKSDDSKKEDSGK